MQFQPIYRLKDEELYGFEALIRWYVNGEIRSPKHFIPLAEETHLIIDIGRWVIREAFERMSQWNKVGNKKLTISINLSAVQLGDNSFLEFIRQLFSQHDLNPSLVEFELTETALIEDKRQCRETIFGLHRLGCSIALDDFGTGFSSIAHLKSFPINTVKIDKSLMPVSEGEDESLLRALAAMIRTMNLKAVAEGIETEAQKMLCAELGVDLVQGYYFSRPLDHKTIEKEFILTS